MVKVKRLSECFQQGIPEMAPSGAASQTELQQFESVGVALETLPTPQPEQPETDCSEQPEPANCSGTSRCTLNHPGQEIPKG